MIHTIKLFVPHNIWTRKITIKENTKHLAPQWRTFKRDACQNQKFSSKKIYWNSVWSPLVRTPLMEMLTVRAWKSTSVKAGDGQNHSYCRPQVVPPATAFFCHTSQGHLRIVLAGVVWPGCLWPSSDCPHLQKSFRDWLVPISLCNISRHRGKGSAHSQTPGDRDSSHPCTAITCFCWAPGL